jgi:uncharacterized protein YndB with AHSA1/START domain
MRALKAAGLLGLACFVVGCATTESATIIDESGAVKRTVSVSMPEMPMAEAEAPGPSDFIKLLGDGWETEEGNEEGNLKLTGRREIAAGSGDVLDYELVDGEGHKVICTVTTVKEGSRITYTETYVWDGPQDEEDPTEDADELLDDALKPFSASADQTNKLKEQIKFAIWRKLFGPADPIFGSLLSNPSSGARKLTAAGGESMMEVLTEEFPDSPRSQRLEAVRSFFKGLLESEGWNEGVQPADPTAPPAEGEEGDSSPMMSILSAVSGPGTLVEHNGQYDIVQDQVFWSMYFEAPMWEPVVLRAVYELD